MLLPGFISSRLQVWNLFAIMPQRMKKLTAYFVLTASLLFPSCVQWNIGENIRENAQWRFAVDTTHLYRCEGDEANTTIVPEVRFHDSKHIIDVVGYGGPFTWPHGYEYTGRYRVLKEARNEYGNKRLDVGEVYDLAGRTLHRLPDRKRLPYWHPHYRPDTTIASAGERAQVAAVDGQEVTVPSECIRGGENYRSLEKRGLTCWNKCCVMQQGYTESG